MYIGEEISEGEIQEFNEKLNDINACIARKQLEQAKTELEKIILDANNDGRDIFLIISTFCEKNFDKEKKRQDAEDVVVNVIDSMLSNKNNLRLKINHVFWGLLNFYFRNKTNGLPEIMFKIMKKSPYLVSDLMKVFMACGGYNDKLDDIEETFLKLLKKKQEFDKIEKFLFPTMVGTFVIACFEHDIEMLWKYCEEVISEVIKSNPKLAYDIIHSTTKLMVKERDFNIAEKILCSISLDDKKESDLMKEYLVLFLSRYLENALFSLQDSESFGKKERDVEVEERILELLKGCNVIDSSIVNFDDIPVKSLIDYWAKYFNGKIKGNGIDGGQFFEILPYLFIDYAKEKTIGDLFNDKILSHFYFATECREDLFKIDFLLEQSKSNKDIFIIFKAADLHVFVSIIEQGKETFIDSSHAIEGSSRFSVVQGKLKKNGVVHYEDFFNEVDYQENGTCYLNAGLAFKIILDLAGKKKSLKDALDYLHEGELDQQNIIKEISKEVIRFYEILERDKNPDFIGLDDSSFLSVSEQTPIAQVAQTVQNGTKVQQLKKGVRQLKIDRQNFIIVVQLLMRELQSRNCKITVDNEGIIAVNKDQDLNTQNAGQGAPRYPGRRTNGHRGSYNCRRGGRGY